MHRGRKIKFLRREHQRSNEGPLHLGKAVVYVDDFFVHFALEATPLVFFNAFAVEAALSAKLQNDGNGP